MSNKKSDFMSSAEKMKELLGPALCLAKWKQVSLHLPTGLNNSCYHPPLHQIPVSSLQRDPSSLHNTGFKKEQRKLMLAGEKPAECSYCWAAENNNQLSDRFYRSSERWASKDYNKIINSTGDESINPSYVEVNFNHGCNLKCSYCSPQFSSTWMQEIDKEGGYPTASNHNSQEYFFGNRRPIPASHDNPYVDAFWEWWPTLYPELDHFRMTGGEPLMDKNTYKVFDYVLANPSPKLHLDVTSNFSVEPVLFDKYMGYVKKLCSRDVLEHFMQYVSIDSVGTQAEYIRFGLNYDRMMSNVHRFLSENPNCNSLTFIVTMNNLSITGLKPLLETILELRKQYCSEYLRVWFDTPLLRQPYWQSIQILPYEYSVQLEKIADWMEEHIITDQNPTVGFKDYEIQRMRRNVDWMREKLPESVIADRKADFYLFFNEHDRRRGTNFLETFPEMAQWWDETQRIANIQFRR